MEDVTKDKDEQPAVDRARSGRLPSIGALVQVEMGVHHPPGTRMPSPTWKLGAGELKIPIP